MFRFGGNRKRCTHGNFIRFSVPAIAVAQGNINLSPIPTELAASSSLSNVPQALASLAWPPWQSLRLSPCS